MDPTSNSIISSENTPTVNEQVEDKCSDIIIRQARLDDIAQICDWRTKELGYTSHTNFFQTIFNHYSEGWFVAEEPDGSIIGSILGINLDETTAFGSFYAVRSKYRCKGIGSKLWDKRLKYIGPRNLAMNAADTRLDANTKAGLTLAFKLTGFCGQLRSNLFAKVKREVEMKRENSQIFNLATYTNREQIIESLITYDTLIHTIPRAEFIKELIDTTEIVTYVALAGNKYDTDSKLGNISGYGMLRPLCQGYIVGPLYADEPEIARALLLNLVATIEEPDKTLTILYINEDFNSHLKLPYISDSQQANITRKELIENTMDDLNLSYEFDLYRMYSTNRVPPKLPLSKVYALTSIECFLT